MPTLISRGTASARAFGLTGSSSGQLYTQTFGSNGTFTPMAGVTNVVTLVGRGGSSTSDYPTFGQFQCTVEANIAGTGPNPPPLAWSTVAADIYTAGAQMNVGGDQTGYLFNLGSFGTYADQTWYGTTYQTSFDYFTVAGTWTVEAFNAPVPPSGNVGYAQGLYRAQGTYIAPGSGGTNSSALGYSFPAAQQVGSYPNATGQSAATFTYNNIAVTPGTNYPIVVGGGGVVQISFIIP